jgi:hypothetical protein
MEMCERKGRTAKNNGLNILFQNLKSTVPETYNITNIYPT